MTPRVYTGRLFYDGSYTDTFQWVKLEDIRHLLKPVEPTVPRFHQPAGPTIVMCKHHPNGRSMPCEECAQNRGEKHGD